MEITLALLAQLSPSSMTVYPGPSSPAVGLATAVVQLCTNLQLSTEGETVPANSPFGKISAVLSLVAARVVHSDFRMAGD